MSQVGARTEVGRVRVNNEDAFVALPGVNVFAVADGVGGQEAGEVASRAAIEALAAAVGDVALPRALESWLREVAEQAHHAVCATNRAQNLEAATTLTAAVVRGRELTLVHAGDSKAFAVDTQGIRQLTRDHTLMRQLLEEGSVTPEEAARHPRRHAITKALGQEGALEAEVTTATLPAGATLLLCTDGLTDMVSEDEIARIVRAPYEAQECADRLVAAALRNGGRDNVTVIVVRRDDARPRKSTRIKRLIAGLLIGLLVGLTASVTLANWYLNQRYFIGEQGGRVTFFQGIPIQPLGYRLHRIVERTHFPTGIVLPPYNARLQQGIVVSDLADARGKLADLLPAESTGARLAFIRDGSLLIMAINSDGSRPVESPEVQVCSSLRSIDRLWWWWKGHVICAASPNDHFLMAAKAEARAVSLGEPTEKPEEIVSPNCRYRVRGSEIVDLRDKSKTHLSSGEQALEWSPDSRWLLVRRLIGTAQASSTAQLCAYSPDAKEKRIVASSSVGSFSPDSRHVLYLRESRTSTHDLCVTDLSGRRSALVASSFDGAFAVYAPSGEAP